MYTLHALSVLASAGLGAAAACSGTLTIKSSTDASALSSCGTWTGNVIIDRSAADSILLDGVSKIDGDLTAINVNNVNSLQASSLQTITGAFTLKGVRTLTSLSFPQLSSVGSITWQTLPALGGLDFSTGISDAGSVEIVDTQIGNLTGIKLTTVDSLLIQSNGVLTDIDLDLRSVSSDLTITNVAGTEMNVRLDSLVKAKAVNIQNIKSLSLGSLQTVGGAIFIASGALKTISLPKLQSIESSLTINKNKFLNKLSLPALTDITGGFNIFSCPDLTKVDGAPKLESVNGAIDFAGNFDTVELPALKSVKGAFHVESSQDISDSCAVFEKEQGPNDVIRGEFTCKGNTEPKNSKNQVSAGCQGSGCDNGGADDGDGAASTIVPSFLALAAVLLAPAFGLF